MNCPRCKLKLDDAAIRSAAARMAQACVKNAGRPKKPTDCKKCGAPCPSAVEARKHCMGKRLGRTEAMREIVGGSQ